MSQSVKGNAPQEVSQFARRGKAGAAGEDALGYAAAAFTRAGFADPNLVLRWSEIAGAEVARIARPVKLQQGPAGALLTVKCDSGAMVFLQHETRGLIERLNAYLGVGRIARLKLVPGSIDPTLEPARHSSRVVESPSDSSIKGSLAEALERLGRRRAKAKVTLASRPAGLNRSPPSAKTSFQDSHRSSP